MHKDIKYYFINKFETNNIDKQDKQTIIIYRNYSSEIANEKHILKIKNYCKKKRVKFYISNNIQLEHIKELYTLLRLITQVFINIKFWQLFKH